MPMSPVGRVQQQPGVSKEKGTGVGGNGRGSSYRVSTSPEVPGAVDT